MIIDQLPLLGGDAASTDECPIERGTTTYKVTIDRLLAALPKDAVPTEDSANAVESGGVYDALQALQSEIDSKQAAITANGILKGNGSAVSAATKGTDYGSDALQITLTAAGWTSNEQTISNAFFASGFVFLAEPVQASKADYGSAGVYADDVSTSGQLTFHCTTSPSSDLTVNVVRIVSASGKTINIAGGGSSGGSEWKLLWTNPNPTSSFDAQTITIDLSKYQEVGIKFAGASSGDDINWNYVGYGFIPMLKTPFFTYSGMGGSGDVQYRRRTFTITLAGVEFSACTNKVGTAAPTTTNGNNIPLEIYAR